MTSAIDIKRYGTRGMACMARATAHVRSFWKFFHFVNQFPRPARKNGHPVLSLRFLSRVFVITISSHLNPVHGLCLLELCRSAGSIPARRPIVSCISII